MEYPTDPQVGIVWETREVLSLIGIIIFGTSAWYYGRKFDEDGSLAYQTVLDTMNGVDYNAVDDNGHPLRKFVTNADGSRDAISVCTEDNRREDIIIIPTDALQRALPIPHGCIIGIFLWTISFLFLPGEGTALPYTGWNLFCVCLLPIMTILFITRIRTSTLERNLQDKKKTLSLIFLLSIILIIASIVDPEIEAPWYFAVFGGESLLLLLIFFCGGIRGWGLTAQIDLTQKTIPNLLLKQTILCPFRFTFIRGDQFLSSLSENSHSIDVVVLHNGSIKEDGDFLGYGRSTNL